MIIVGAFYILTAFWIVYLWMLFEATCHRASHGGWFAWLYLKGGLSECICGSVDRPRQRGVIGPLYRPAIALLFAVAQVVYLHRASQSA